MSVGTDLKSRRRVCLGACVRLLTRQLLTGKLLPRKLRLESALRRLCAWSRLLSRKLLTGKLLSRELRLTVGL